MENLQRFIKVKDSSGAGTIWTCCVACLGHLAALSNLIGRTEPTLRSSMDDLCDLTLEKLGNLSHEVQIEEHSHFDILTGVRALVVLSRMWKALTDDANQMSWERALDTIDLRIGLCPDVKGESLWSWKEVIGKACIGHQANILKCGPSLFASLALLEDGRTEDSSFPNLLLPTEREPYGL